MYIGIDPSLNSTGISVLLYDDEKLVDYKFYIIKADKQTKKELNAEKDKNNHIKYIICTKEKSDNYHLNELYKANYYIKIIDSIYDIIVDIFKNNIIDGIYICQEGISYGSTNTKSIFDLAGLNYLIRKRMIELSDYTESVVKYIICPPSEIKKFAVGNGNAPKTMIVQCFQNIFPDVKIPKIDDIADSFFMAQFIKKDSN